MPVNCAPVQRPKSNSETNLKQHQKTPMTPNDKDPGIITLPDVRLSFPHLFTPHTMPGSEDTQEPKFSATFLFDNTKHSALLDRIDAIIDRLALDEFKKKISFKRCLRDGNDKSELEGYGDGTSFISASNKARPGVVDRRLNPIAESDGIVYAGCYVNATIRLWVQNNTWGKRVNAQLRAVQFLRDGESFGAGPVDATKEFEQVDDDTSSTGVSSRPRSGGRSGGKPSTNLDDF